jgi:hypothetical protein
MERAMSDDDDDKVIRLNEVRKTFEENIKTEHLFGHDAAPPNLMNIDWVNNRYRKTIVRGKFRIIRLEEGGRISLMTKDDSKSDMQERKFSVQSSEEGTISNKSLAMMWLNSPEGIKHKDGIVFDPSRIYNKYEAKYNLWNGYNIKPISGNVLPYLEFVKTAICSGDASNFNFLIALIAQMIQFPHLKPGIAVVIRGDEGVGKSFFVETLCSLVAPYYFKTSNPGYVFGDHNSQLANVILLHLEEAVWAGSKKDESLMKDQITGKTLEINEKFQPIYSVDNHLHLFITGNPDWLVSASFKARRLFALHASEAHIKDIPYFSGLSGWLDNGGRAALMYHFLNQNSNIELRLVPVTDELIEQKKQSMFGIKKWIMNCVESGEWPYGDVKTDGAVEVIKKLLVYSYNTSSEGKRHQLSDNEFGIEFLKMFPKISDGIVEKAKNGRTVSIIQTGPNIKFDDSNGNPQYGYIIPPLRTIRDVIDADLGGGNNWDDRAEWTTDKLNVSDIVDALRYFKRPF